MISLIIVFATFVLALIDKPKLFEKPIHYKKITVFAIILIVAVCSAIKEFGSSYEQSKANSTIDSLYVGNKFLTSQIATLRKENKTSQKEYVDSLVSYHLYTTDLLASYGLKVDTLTGTIIKMDKSLIKEIPPTLRIDENVVIIKNDRGEYQAQFILEALNADVHFKGLRYILINYKNGIPLEDEIYLLPSNVLNYTSIISKGELKPLYLFMDRFDPKDQFNRTDTCIVAVECDYKSKGDKYQTPVRKIYMLITDPIPRGFELSSYNHLLISNILKKKKVWPVFYDL